LIPTLSHTRNTPQDISKANVHGDGGDGKEMQIGKYLYVL
jgi:hypothetical protein